jgi:hypothetical protein
MRVTDRETLAPGRGYPALHRICEKVPGAEKIAADQFRRWMAVSLFPDRLHPEFLERGVDAERLKDRQRRRGRRRPHRPETSAVACGVNASSSKSSPMRRVIVRSSRATTAACHGTVSRPQARHHSIGGSTRSVIDARTDAAVEFFAIRSARSCDVSNDIGCDGVTAMETLVPDHR